MVGFAVEATARMVDGEEVEFVAARVNDHWLLKAVGGEGVVKGHCRDSEVLRMLKHKMANPKHAPIEDQPAAVAVDDPMNKLIRAGAGTPPPKRPKVQHTVSPCKSAKLQVSRIRVPRRFGEPAEDVEVLAYQTQAGHVCIRAMDVPWFVAYIYEELSGGKIPEPWDPDVESPTAVAEDAVAIGAKPYRVAWSPNGSWTATVTRGPLRGKEFVSFARDLSQEKWVKGAALLGHTKQWADDQRKRGDRSTMKNVLLDFISDSVDTCIDEAKKGVGFMQLGLR